MSLPEPWEDHTPTTLQVPCSPPPPSEGLPWTGESGCTGQGRTNWQLSACAWKSPGLRKSEMPEKQSLLPLHSQIPSPQGDACVSLVMGPKGRKEAAESTCSGQSVGLSPELSPALSLPSCVALSTISSFWTSVLSAVNFNHSTNIHRPSSLLQAPF